MNNNRSIAIFLCLLIFTILSLCANAEESLIVVNRIYSEEKVLWIEFENKSGEPLGIIDKVSPEWGVCRYLIHDRAGKEVLLQAKGADWLVKIGDIVIVPAGRRLSIPVVLNLPLGEFVVSVDYCVKKNSSFIEPWLNGSFSSASKEDSEVMRLMVWLGLSSSEMTTLKRQ